MRGKPLFPYAGIAVVGILLMIGLSLMGVNEKSERLASEGEGDKPAQQQPADASNPVAAGEEYYKASCIGCHGGNFDGPMGNLNGLAERRTKEEIVDIIVNGYQGAAGVMPPGMASPDKADAIAEYLLEATK